MSHALQDKSVPKHSIVIISDTHLGQKNRPKGKLDKFLKNLDCETLVMNGDIMDGLRIAGRSKKKLSTYDLNIMDALNEKIAQGVKVIYIPGNHDEELRKMDLYGKTFMGITFAEYYEYKTPEGKNFFISHGDQFDDGLQHTTQTSSRLFKIGDFFHDTAEQAERLINKFSRVALKKEFDIYGFVRNDAYRRILELTKVFTVKSSGKKSTLHNLKQVGKILKERPAADRDFREAALARARKGGYDGIVCGHTHIPEVSKSSDGITYANSGDWVRHFSALVMNKNGEWEIFRHKDNAPQKQKKKKSKKISHSDATKEMAKAVNKVWPRKIYSSIYNGYKGP